MRTTIDWDEEIPQAADDRNMLDVLRLRYRSTPWELRKSSSGNGWHFIAYEAANDTREGLATTNSLREQYGDDDKRLRLDRARWQKGSPFMQVLYRRKYMERSEWPAEEGSGYSTGHAAEVVEQSQAVKAAPEEERVKDPDSGELDYQRALRLALDRKGWTATDLGEYLGTRQEPNVYAAESGGRSAGTVRTYLRGERPVTSDAVRRWTRRQLRSRGIGHMSETEDGGRAAEEVRWIDPEDERRTLVEYIDVPIDFKIGADPEDREYGLLNVHTGTFNDNHTDRQLRAVHEEAAEHVMEVLSPTSPDGTTLNVEGRNEHFQGVSGWTREFDSVNWERELLDDGEADVYLGNLPDHAEIDDHGQHIQIEVILWDQDMRSMEWHALVTWTGSSVDDATVLRESGLGSW